MVDNYYIAVTNGGEELNRHARIDSKSTTQMCGKPDASTTARELSARENALYTYTHTHTQLCIVESQIVTIYVPRCTKVVPENRIATSLATQISVWSILTGKNTIIKKEFWCRFIVREYAVEIRCI